MCPLSMVSEGISVKRSAGTGRTGQFCAQMGLTYMTAYGCSGSGGSLCTSLNTTVKISFGVTHIDSQRLNLSWYCFPFGLRNGEMRAPCIDSPTSGLAAIASDPLAVRLEIVAVGTCLCLLGRGRCIDTDSSGSATAH